MRYRSMNLIFFYLVKFDGRKTCKSFLSCYQFLKRWKIINYKVSGRNAPSFCPLWFDRVSSEKVCLAYALSCFCSFSHYQCGIHSGQFFHSFNQQFTPDDVLKLLDRFYNLEMLVGISDLYLIFITIISNLKRCSEVRSR